MIRRSPFSGTCRRRPDTAYPLLRARPEGQRSKPFKSVSIKRNDYEFQAIHLLVCAGLLLLVWFKRERLRSWKGELHFRFVLAFLMFLMEFSFFLWLLYVGDSSGNYLMMSKLPLHLCDIGLCSCMFMVPSKNRTHCSDLIFL